MRRGSPPGTPPRDRGVVGGPGMWGHRAAAGRAARGSGRQWAALSPVSGRCVYAGVVEESVYIAEAARGRGVGRGAPGGADPALRGCRHLDDPDGHLPGERREPRSPRGRRLPRGRPQGTPGATTASGATWSSWSAGAPASARCTRPQVPAGPGGVSPPVAASSVALIGTTISAPCVLPPDDDPSPGDTTELTAGCTSGARLDSRGG